ncbi:MAG TPA: biotin synthase BioB [Candidatus Acidoferrales bacterium]|nr:biotin synthase BioB [Candidatus Acidoferrales bacterium]
MPAAATSIRDTISNSDVRHDWTRGEIRRIYELPLTDLVFHAQGVHRAYHPADEVQLCRLLSIKTGGCPEDCAYCPQSAHYSTGVRREALLDVDDVLAAARRAKSDGATRFCMGAAWREAPEGKEFEAVLTMVRGVAETGMEVCCTLGMLTEDQAKALKGAGLTAYNHNLDTSPEFYGSIIHTRVYDERLRTIAAVRKAGITVCCGGILGMGETDEDRIGLIEQLARMNPHPESVPINTLVRAEGTPLENQAELDPLVMVRTIATARITMPRARVRLAAGRLQMSREAAALCFLAGANSIFTGEKLLTTPNPEPSEDEALLRDLGLKPLELASHDK